MECMHRFCGDCIQRCLRGGKQECPACRQHVPSKRSLRRDHAFDALIKQVYSDIDRYEEMEEKRMIKLNRIHSQKVSTDLNQQIKQQKENQLRMRLSKTNAAKAAKESRETKNARENRETRKREAHQKKQEREERKKRRKKKSAVVIEDDNARFQLMVDPQEKNLPELKHSWLCTSKQIQVRHLKKYLSRKLNIDAHRIEITYFVGGTTLIILDDKSRFIEIEALQQSNDEHVILYFKIAG
jgi:E3 ubiquitin-protein ligase RNF1/2